MKKYFALAIALASGTVGAQSSSGSIYGQAGFGAGSAEGLSVYVENTDTGFERELPVQADGRYSFSALPPGNYTVMLKQGAVATKMQNATVIAGVGTPVNFGGPEVVETIRIDEIEALGGALMTPIDVSTAQTTTIYSAQRMEVVPVAKDITSVALLAPGTTLGDDAFNDKGNLASFSGSSVAENSYYVNGFNVTNLFKNLSYSQIPFYAIAEQQVITGGYGPEYGLSTGGVISLTTMKGSNSWMAGGAATWEPDRLRKRRPRTFTADKEAFQDYDTKETRKIYDLWAGGPIITDRLFVYGIFELTQLEQTDEPRSYDGGNYEELDQENPFGMLRVDWAVNDEHLLNFTYINDTREYNYKNFLTEPDAQGFLKPSAFGGTEREKEGGNIYIVGYTGYLSDELTLTAQYGRLESKRELFQIAPNGTHISYDGVVGNFNQPGCPLVLVDRTYANAHPDEPVASCWISTTIPTAVGKDERKAGRLDLEWRAPGDFFGTHTLKAGYEIDRWSTFFGESYSGGNYYRYYHVPGEDGEPGTADDLPAGPDGQMGTSDDSDYVRVRHFQTGAHVGVDTDAFYIKDSWDLDGGWLLTLGLRNDSFKNLNGAGQAYAQQDNIWQPRVGVAWDVFEDASQKVYGSYGIYSLPIAATVAVRGASASLFDSQTFYFSEIDPVTGTPTLTEARTDRIFLNAENGSTPNPASVASQGLDPTIQNEFILGYQTQLPDGWTGGVRATLRDLDTTIDDMCDYRPFEQWAADNGLEFSPAEDFPGCFLFNPGESMRINGDINGDGTPEDIQLTPEMIGSPKIARKYYAMEFVLEKTTPEWFTQLSYTWAHNYGNAEGLVKSDIGQDDTGVTQDFDHPELMRGASGNLPNDRRHTLKGTSGLKLGEEWGVSGSLLWQSGRPQNCIGVDSTVPEDYNYGASYFTCGGRLVPRGTAGKTESLLNMDFGLSYTPGFVNGLMLQAKIFNLLNSEAETAREETGESVLTNTDGTVSGVPLSSYRTPTSYQRPRYFQFTARYDFNF